MKRTVAFLFFSLMLFSLHARTIFSTQRNNSSILLEKGKNSPYFHVMVSGKMSKYTKDIVHIYFKEEVNSYDYVKSILEKTPENNTYWQFVNHSVKLDKTGILYWNDYLATKKYMKGNCFIDERFYYSYDTERFAENKLLSAENKEAAQ